MYGNYKKKKKEKNEESTQREALKWITQLWHMLKVSRVLGMNEKDFQYMLSFQIVTSM